MTQLQYSTGSFRASRVQTQTSPQQRLFGIAFAISMEAALVYALLMALGYVDAPKPPSVLKIVNVAPQPKSDDPIPPPTQIFEPPPLAIDAPVVTLDYIPPVPPIT